MILVAILAMANPLLSDEYCQNMIPPLHLPYWYPLATAWDKDYWSIHPVLQASIWRTGLPTIILYNGTPLSAIYFTEVPGKYPADSMKSRW